MTHPLDNPAWHALTGPHASLALGAAPALRFPADVSPFLGLEGGAAPADFAKHLPPGTIGGTLLPQALEPSPGIEILGVFPLIQMIAPSVEAVESDLPLEELTDADAPEMVALTELTRPGPFALRTIAMGAYLGIRDGARLTAMTGQRLHLPAFQEVSAVCTHPDYLGRGYARLLVSRVARQILAAGKTPFLHVVTDNTGAISVYRKLGFTARREMVATFLRRVG
ncbi:hypothetical protein sos41_19580 [Alphaproteobacteria bacterium SO-S41]|nr:hypothetical protein sos41_19580 [Alphaproteobacteria bacterium SO-S41]